MTARLGRQGPAHDPHRDGCGPLIWPWAFLAIAVIPRVVWAVVG